MYKLVVLVLAVAASAFADTQLLKSSSMGAQILPAGAAYVSPLSGYATGYTAGAPAYPQYQQYAQYPAGYPNYAQYAGYAAYPGYQAAYPAGYQGLVSPMAYSPVSAGHISAYPYGSQVVYQQKPIAAAPAHSAYTVL